MAHSHLGNPAYQHDCNRCEFLGQTIGRGQRVDLYVCDTSKDRSPTLVARYSSDGPDYCSTDANYAHATGHSELFAAQYLWMQREKE